MAVVTFNRDQNGVDTSGGSPFFSIFDSPATILPDGFALTVQDNDQVHVLSFTGTNLSYQTAGDLITDILAGQIKAMSESTGGVVSFSATGFSISAAGFFDAALSGDEVYFQEVILAGDDTMYGTDGRRGDVLAVGAGHDQLYGYNGDDVLAGEAGRDTIEGGGGNDTLKGGEGRDVLVGNKGADTFEFTGRLNAAHADKIRDFAHGVDQFYVKWGLGNDGGRPFDLAQDAFHLGTVAADAEDRVIYDAATGRVLYDKDGFGGDDAVLFATVKAGITLDHTDFLVG